VDTQRVELTAIVALEELHEKLVLACACVCYDRQDKNEKVCVCLLRQARQGSSNKNCKGVLSHRKT
jgi:hypothetical protein